MFESRPSFIYGSNSNLRFKWNQTSNTFLVNFLHVNVICACVCGLCLRAHVPYMQLSEGWRLKRLPVEREEHPLELGRSLAANAYTSLSGAACSPSVQHNETLTAAMAHNPNMSSCTNKVVLELHELICHTLAASRPNAGKRTLTPSTRVLHTQSGQARRKTCMCYRLAEAARSRRAAP